MSGDAASASQVSLDFEMLFRAAPTGSVITGTEHTIVDANDAFIAWTGLTRAELVGTSFMRLLPAGDRVLFSTRSQPLLDLTGRVPETAVTILGRDRAALPAAFTASSVRTDPGLTMFIVGPRRERSFEEAQLISAVHRADDADARRREAEDDLERQASYDALTGLMNRTGLIAALTSTITGAWSGREIATYWIGLDHFRVVNESLGSTAGDEILAVLAQRLQAAYDGESLLARPGGDEFVVAVAAGSHEDFARSLLSLIAEPVIVDDLEIIISASIGIATYDFGASPVPGSDIRTKVEALLRHAGTGTHEAKAAGRNRWKRVTATPDDSAINELQLLGELRAAIGGDQLRLEYQPQLDLHTGTLHGVEALVRWDHPTRGLVAPDAFIGVAEKTGLINQLGAWVCRTAVAEATELRDRAGAESIHMSVNISARQLSDPHFASFVETVLRESSLDPAWLTLEITETSTVTDASRARENLERLHDEGVRFSIDDFGTGHAGFSYLSDYPIDEIKIDRTFVSNLEVSPEAAAIVTSCIEVAHALDLTVVAEGVETAAQLARLTELGCDIAQGFYYSRPLRAEALRAFLGELGAIGRAPAAR
ncbi:MAG: putative bifunctional diguanylate cyclase/phosphodiesterase [Demequina sp.]